MVSLGLLAHRSLAPTSRGWRYDASHAWNPEAFKGPRTAPAQG